MSAQKTLNRTPCVTACLPITTSWNSRRGTGRSANENGRGGKFAIGAIRWAYLEQVGRWEVAEGRELGVGVGFSPLEEGELATHFAERLFEEGGRFAETEFGLLADSLD